MTTLEVNPLQVPRLFRKAYPAELTPEDQTAALRATGLDPGEHGLALAQLSAGSVGTAARLLAQDGLELYSRLVDLVDGAPGLNRAGALELGAACIGAANAQRYDMTLSMLATLLSRLARFGAMQPATWTEAAPHEARVLSKLAPNAQAGRRWADLAASLAARTGHARAVNIDPGQVILDAFLQIDACARPG